ncbi:MAG TPA: sulfatase-like hydrolase/transferase [bacterium]|nr:sulfatase-like hydrolase/transferase [bacterium]
MRRREFIKSGAAAAGLALSAGKVLSAPARPNVLIILVDQMRMPRWTPLLHTPNIDGLAAAGVSFTNHFVSAVPCSPSRACLMTGTYTTQNQMYSNCDFVEGNLQPSLDPRIPTLGSVFRNAGFRTPYRGKWHLTRRADRNQKDALGDYGFEGWKPPEAYFGGPPYCGAAFDPMYAGRAVEWLSAPSNRNDPWLLVCSLVNPHDICGYPRYYPQQKFKEIRTAAAPNNWSDDLTGKPGCQREYQERYTKVGGPMDLADPDAWRRYLDYYIHCQEDVDENIGKVLSALERSGQRENTIVVFTADHGEMAGSHRLRTKGCFAYEEVMNVPLIFSWPGRLPAGVTTEAFASNVDVMPTLVSLTGVTNPDYMAGVDLAPVLADPGSPSARSEIIYHQDWEVEFTIGKSANEQAIFKNPAHVRCLRESEWKYAYYFAPGRDDVEHELYNLKDDPLEMTNLANDAGYAAKRKEMYERLMEEEGRLKKEFES